jgi:hypothetical protein
MLTKLLSTLAFASITVPALMLAHGASADSSSPAPVSPPNLAAPSVPALDRYEGVVESIDANTGNLSIVTRYTGRTVVVHPTADALVIKSVDIHLTGLKVGDTIAIRGSENDLKTEIVAQNILQISPGSDPTKDKNANRGYQGVLKTLPPHMSMTRPDKTTLAVVANNGTPVVAIHKISASDIAVGDAIDVRGANEAGLFNADKIDVEPESFARLHYWQIPHKAPAVKPFK